MSEFKAGDIVINTFTTETNPYHRLLYLRKCTIRQGRYTSKGYECLDYEGRKRQYFREHDPLVKVGHMAEYDEFIKALRTLRMDGDTNGPA